MYTTRARNNKWSSVVEIGLRTRTISLFYHKYALKPLFYKKKFNIYIFLHPETSIMLSRRSQSQLLLHPLPFDCCSALMAAPRVRDGSRYVHARARGLQHAIHRQQLIKLLRDLVAARDGSRCVCVHARTVRVASHQYPHHRPLRARQLAPRVRIRARDVSRYARARARGGTARATRTHMW